MHEISVENLEVIDEHMNMGALHDCISNEINLEGNPSAKHDKDDGELERSVTLEPN